LLRLGPWKVTIDLDCHLMQVQTNTNLLLVGIISGEAVQLGVVAR
jgi:hypothetical protein